MAASTSPAMKNEAGDKRAQFSYWPLFGRAERAEECLFSMAKRKWRRPEMTSGFDPGCVETPFIPQKLQRIGVVHVDVTA
jgi:hypothetical protein